MITQAILLLVGGFVVLVAGAEFLVRGASRIAVRLGISPLVVGLTVVAFGTSAPEMAVSVKSALADETGAAVAIGNVVGSNIANVLLILGISALFAPLIVEIRLVRIEVPLMIAASLLVLGLSLDGSLGRADGAVLFAGILLYVGFTVRTIKRSPADSPEHSEEPVSAVPLQGRHGIAWNAFLFLVGLGGLVLGADWLVDGAVSMARSLGVSELVIGLTIVAIGTSLPELATSVLASLRGERDIAVGNVAGSNLFNLLAVLGLGGLVAPEGLSVSQVALRFDLPVMIATAIACFPIFLTGGRIHRWEGAAFVGFYAGYLVFLILQAKDHESAGTMADAFVWFIFPITALTLVVTVVLHFRKTRGGT